MTRWVPAMLHHERRYAHRPEPGWLIAMNRTTWVVVDVREGDQHDDFLWELIVHSPDASDRHLSARFGHQLRAWWPLPEHYAVCHRCGDLAPCRAHTDAILAAEQAVRMERELRLLPGCCPACQEPVTSRQRSIVFEGEYVRNPLGPPDVAFHLRRECRGEAARYEEAWVRADPTRARSLLTLTCAGTVVVCGDRHAECFGADDQACPSIHARHRGYTACWAQTHGCGRQCGSHTHGTRFGRRDADPRALS